MEEDKDNAITSVTIESILKNQSIPKIYCNGFISGNTPHDVFIIPLLNGTAQITLNLSFSAAKSLIESLSKTINNIEKAMGQEIKSF